MRADDMHAPIVGKMFMNFYVISIFYCSIMKTKRNSPSFSHFF